MKKTTLNIKIFYNELGRAEKRIADWILNNEGKILSLSIVELAEQCQCGEATIVRFAKRLGFSGYQELKLSLAQETRGTVVNTHMSSNDDAFAIYEKVCNDIYCSLEKTKNILSKEALEQTAKAIMGAEKIVVFGLGNSAAVAMDAAHKLLRAGYNAFAYTDNHMQVIAASHLGKGDVAIAISHSGSSKDVVEALAVSRDRGATTISITNHGKSPIQKHSDWMLHTASDETEYNILAMNSRIAQLSIIDALYFHLVYQQSEKALNSIKDTEDALKTKKY